MRHDFCFCFYTGTTTTLKYADTARVARNCPEFGKYWRNYCNAKDECKRAQTLSERTKICAEFKQLKSCALDPYAQSIINAGKFGGCFQNTNSATFYTTSWKKPSPGTTPGPTSDTGAMPPFFGIQACLFQTQKCFHCKPG